MEEYLNISNNTCVSCGEIIPEGRQVCYACLHKGECPCKYCVAPRRFIGCHGGCIEYKEWRDNHIQEATMLRKNKNIQSIADDHVIRVTIKNTRKKPYEKAYRK